MRVLGIDPGSVICGYGVVDYIDGRLSLVEYGVIKAAKKEEAFPIRLKVIFERLSQVIERTNPNESSFETIFYDKNVQSIIKLSHARSAAMLAVVTNDIPVMEYTPREVKKAVTGLGNAGKEQVRYMVKKLLNIYESHEFYDATDALAVAICHTIRNKNVSGNNSTWEIFLKNNPDRIKIIK